MSLNVSAVDVQRYGLDGDPDFSEARNRAIYKSAEDKSKKLYEKKQKMIAEGIAERSDLVYSYIRHQLDNKKDMEITEYAGWENMKKLWGETRVRELQDAAAKKGMTLKYFTKL